MVIARNTLFINKHNYTELIKNTKFEKEKVIDKIHVNLFKNCLKILNDNQTEEILSVDNINKVHLPQQLLLKINFTEIHNEPEFDSEELNLLKFLNGV